MKKLLIIAAAIAGVLLYNKKVRESEARKTAWSKATDKVD